MSYVGIRFSGTWVGTVYTEASIADYGNSGPGGGANFKSVGVYQKITATTAALAGSSFTANGTFYWPVQNYATFQVRFTRTSGSLLATLAASIDSSYGDAWLSPSGRFLNSYANGTQNVLTIPADSNYGRRLRSLVVSAAPHVGGGGGVSSSAAGGTTASWASNPVLRIYDGTAAAGELLYASDLPNALPFQYSVPLPYPQTASEGVSDGGVFFTPGNVGTIVIASGGSNITTNANAECPYS